MINLRYHIVSITAVFLALGIGITMGSTFLGKAAVDRIDTNVRQAQEDVRNTRADNSDLRKQVSLDRNRNEKLIDGAIPRLFADTLTEVPIVVIAEDGVDQGSLDKLRLALTASGARFDGTLVATDKLGLDGDSVGDLATAIDSTTTEVATLRRQALNRLSAELLAAAEPPVPVPDPAPDTTTTAPPDTGTTVVPGPGGSAPETQGGEVPSTTTPSTTTTIEPLRREPSELIGALIDAGFLDYEPALGGAARPDLLTARGYRYVIVTGSSSNLTPDQFLTPFLAAMTAPGSAPVVVASAAVGTDAEKNRGSALAPLIKDKTVGDRLSTVDNLEALNGVLAVVWSVQDLERNRYGHYGFGDDANTQLPAARG